MRRKRIILLGILSLVVVSSFGAGAQYDEANTTTLYENETVSVQNESWLEGRETATLANTTNMLTRVSTFIVGSSASGSGGSPVGALVSGILIFGVVLGAVGSSRVGFVAGGTLGTTAAFGIFSLGMFPLWIWALILMALGGVVSAVLIRLFR